LQPRISASSYSNTAPLIWSFLYGSQHGRVELILDNAPARSAELLSQDRVDAALVPVIAYHELDGVRLVPNVCVGAKEKVRSVCLVTRGMDLSKVRSVALDVSSRTSVVLTKIIFREFLGFEPEWRDREPDIDGMLAESDAALLIGDPALKIADLVVDSGRIEQGRARGATSELRKFDLAQVWKAYTGTGFVFAMWMSRRQSSAIDFAAARDEGLEHIDEIVSNYESEIGLGREELMRYLSENISYSVDEGMRAGMDLYFDLAGKCGLIGRVRPIEYLE
jgi:chorismate dehydratase